MMLKLADPLDLGFSVGYVWGPNSDASLSIRKPGLSGTVTDKRTVNFVRALVEPVLNAPLSETVVFHMGFGVGVAQAREERGGEAVV